MVTEYTTKVYTCGLRPPAENADLVSEQIRLGHRYYNRLIEIEHEKRQRDHEIVGAHGDADALQAAIDEQVVVVEQVVARIRRWRIANGKKVASKDLRMELAAAKKSLKAARAELRELRRVIKQDPEIAASRVALWAEDSAARKRARAECGIPHGTYIQVEQAVEAACKAPMAPGCETPWWELPRFKRWKGEGCVGLQLQQRDGEYMDTDALFGRSDPRLQIDPVPSTAWDRRRSREQRTVVRMRIGSECRRCGALCTSIHCPEGGDGGAAYRSPVWASWPMILHRPLPEGALIKWAKVKRERIVGKARWRWSLHLTIDEPEQEPRCGEGTVAVDVGWRKTETGMRVGYWQDDSGDHNSINIDHEILDRLRKVDELESIRKRNMNAAKSQLRAWLATWEEVPDWMREASRHMHAWRSQNRLAGLALHWRQNRWEGDNPGYEDLEDWRKQDKHLWAWQDNLRGKVLRRRREVYRVAAARLAERYDTVVLTDFDLRDTQRHPSDTSTREEIDAVKWQQKAAACSVLRGCIRNAFTSRGGRIVEVEAKLMSRTCHGCGHDGEWAKPEELEHTCQGCGETWDRDVNSTTNMLRAARERSDDDDGRPKKRAAKWAKRHGRSKNENDDDGTSRNAGDKVA